MQGTIEVAQLFRVDTSPFTTYDMQSESLPGHSWSRTYYGERRHLLLGLADNALHAQQADQAPLSKFACIPSITTVDARYEGYWHAAGEGHADCRENAIFGFF